MQSPLPIQDTTLTYLALGDSYTIGESVTEPERFPEQAVALLARRGIRVASPRIIAITGWTTDELAQAIQAAGIKTTYHIVTLLIGVNNQYRGRSLEEYRVQFAQLLEQAIAFAGGDVRRVVVLSIPDWGVTPYAEGRDRAQIATEIDAFNAANKAITLRYGAGYLDITPVSRQGATDATLQAADGLHPSGKQYTLWAQRLSLLLADIAAL
ncbi:MULTISPECIES: SGNH/GDSL hydrolase family protein [Chitinophaga]|uniref:SGNH/GDSL hydrolase family protein n=1 Tax=Chitinophaga TaxID=79328 RepID=UPI000BB0CC34|nr:MULTISPECIES: SGNH/GDSL hydrolase family protein [Chitinophaga]ASZ15141.1 lysophospholipase [Chitinophaga sp. MD30]